MGVETVNTTDLFQTKISAPKMTVALFSADWADQCQQVLEVMKELSKQYDDLQFINIPAEDLPEVSFKHQIDAVPTVIFFQNKAAVERIDGVNVAELSSKCKKYSANTETKVGSLEDRLKALISKSNVMMFMKGDRHTPRCGFSKQLIAILNKTEVPYETFDILTDEEVRQGLKTFSDWPTYPQLYVAGELIGGLDIIKELETSDELKATLKG